MDLEGAAVIEIQRYEKGKKIGEGVRWCDPRKISLDEDGHQKGEYRHPCGQRVRLPHDPKNPLMRAPNPERPQESGGLYYGPWRLKDGRDVGNIDEATAAEIATSLGLVVNCSFPFTPIGRDPCPEPTEEELAAAAAAEAERLEQERLAAEAAAAAAAAPPPGKKK